MEECEALCHRSTIMVNGVLRCIGTNRSIRESYGSGFELMAKVARPNEDKLVALMKQWQVPEDAMQANTTAVMHYSQMAGTSQSCTYTTAALEGPSSPWSESGKHLGVSPRVVAEWWLLTATFKKLHAFVWQLCGPGNAELRDWHGQMARYKLTTNKKLGELFRALEHIKEELGIAEYSLSATTLEQIFNNFVREQEATSSEGPVGATSSEGPVGAPTAVGPSVAQAPSLSRFLELAATGGAAVQPIESNIEQGAPTWQPGELNVQQEPISKADEVEFHIEASASSDGIDAKVDAGGEVKDAKTVSPKKSKGKGKSKRISKTSKREDNVGALHGNDLEVVGSASAASRNLPHAGQAVPEPFVRTVMTT
jgi:hypothetical protein